MRRVHALLLAALLLALLPAAPAQEAAPTLEVTVIVSDVGPAAARGGLERRVAQAWEARQRRAGGIFGLDVRVTIASDASDPERALRAAERAVDGGAHALVCCSTAEASARVAPYAAAAGVPLLSPAGEGSEAAVGWQFALEPDLRAQLQAAVSDMYGRGVTGIGLLTPDAPLGDAAEAALRQLIAVDTMRVVGSERYAPDADALTPEALLVATREPGAILAWDRPAGAARALAGLRARGWQGPVYVPLATLGAAGGVARDDGVRVAAPPALAPDALPETDPRHARILEARELALGRVGTSPYAAEGAILHDALELLALAFEQTAVYGVSPTALRSYRLALRDALVSLGPVDLAAGRYDPAMERTAAASGTGLVVVAPGPDGLAPIR